MTINFKKCYEPVLVSKNIKTNIFGAKTEARFKTCTCDLEKQTLNYTVKNDEHIVVKCCKEQLNVTSAHIEIAKTPFIFDEKVKMMRGRIVEAERMKTDAINRLFSLDSCTYNEGFTYSICDFTTDALKKKIFVPIKNHSGGKLTLKIGQICAEINTIGETDIKVYKSISYIPKFNTEELTHGNLTSEEKNELMEIFTYMMPKSIQCPSIKARFHMSTK